MASPAAYSGAQAAADPVLELTFPMGGSWQTAGVRVRQHADEVTAEVHSSRLEAVRASHQRVRVAICTVLQQLLVRTPGR